MVVWYGDLSIFSSWPKLFRAPAAPQIMVIVKRWKGAIHVRLLTGFRSVSGDDFMVG